MREGNTNNFDGIVGYVPPVAGGRSGYFTGNVFFSMRNLFGTGRKAIVRWQREDQLTQQLEVNYNEPWVAGLPVNAGLDLSSENKTQRILRLPFDVRADINFTTESQSATLSQESVVPSADLTYFSVFKAAFSRWVLAFSGSRFVSRALDIKQVHVETLDELWRSKRGKLPLASR